MKSPISLLTFSSLSVSACIFAEYLSSGEAVFFETVGIIERTVLIFLFRLSSLLFGIFLYFRNTQNRAEGVAGYVNAYFSAVSLVLVAVIPVLMFSHGAYLLSAVFSGVLVLFISLLMSASPSQHIMATICGVPMLIFSAAGGTASVARLFDGW